MRCRDVAQAIEQDGLTPLPEAARGHVADCAACSSLLADFESIVAAATQLPSEVEPHSRVWPGPGCFRSRCRHDFCGWVLSKDASGAVDSCR